MNASLGSREHYELMEHFERTYKHLRLDREVEQWVKQMGRVYQNDETNELFRAFQHGYELGKAITA